ncbi:unnamed protein product [Notodromas monacha]|uniref:ABC transmembrane type-1 domain-containing protein n=1 Tax=Notodromas monacha TaxID=399045 RepID=A0A7R9BEU7_9CRUS|nr:unnamed protein product [Notodromas monacha]CAG0912520.1 unnamed protein product [Notodromas monacha]
MEMMPLDTKELVILPNKMTMAGKQRPDVRDARKPRKSKKKEKKPEEPPLIDGATPVSMFSLVYKIRSLFLQGILRQDIGWFDTHQSGDFASRITEDLNKLQEGIGEKVGMFVYFMTVFVASLISAFVYGWELSLVILSVMPVLMIASGVMAKVQSSIAELELQAYGTAGAAAEEVISSIRTVVAFGGQQKEVQRYVILSRYEERLVTARQLGIKRSLWTGLGGGLAWFMIFVSYALAFWYGPKLILEQRHLENPTYDPSVFMIVNSLLSVFFNVLMGAMNIGQAAPYVEAFAVARAAGGTLFSVIDRQPSIDSSSEAGFFGFN